MIFIKKSFIPQVHSLQTSITIPQTMQNTPLSPLHHIHTLLLLLLPTHTITSSYRYTPSSTLDPHSCSHRPISIHNNLRCPFLAHILFLPLTLSSPFFHSINSTVHILEIHLNFFSTNV